MIGALLIVVAAPLAPSEALEMLSLGASRPNLTALGSACRESADLVLRAPLETPRSARLNVGCAKPRFPKLAARLDKRAGACKTSDEACAAWLTHARAALLDAVGPEGGPADFGTVLTTLAALAVGDRIDTAAANRAIAAASRISAAQAENAAVQRIAYAAWLSLPGDTGDTAAFAAMLPRVLATNGDDTEIWGAFVFMAERSNTTEPAKQFVDALSQRAPTAPQRAKAFYLRACLAVHENDGEAARTAFAAAAKADPFDAAYPAATSDLAKGVKPQCKVVMTPFGAALREVLATPD